MNPVDYWIVLSIVISYLMFCSFAFTVGLFWLVKKALDRIERSDVVEKIDTICSWILLDPRH